MNKDVTITINSRPLTFSAGEILNIQNKKHIVLSSKGDLLHYHTVKVKRLSKWKFIQFFQVCFIRVKIFFQTLI